MEKEVYLIGRFDLETGKLTGYVHKGRNGAISGYDTLSSAKRGLSHSNSTLRIDSGYYHKIVIVTQIEIVE